MFREVAHETPHVKANYMLRRHIEHIQSGITFDTTKNPYKCSYQAFRPGFNVGSLLGSIRVQY